MSSTVKHTWKEERIGHNDFGPVCQVCQVDFICGMSELGCPERLWDYHWLEDNNQVNFTEPTKVEVTYEYEPLTEEQKKGDSYIRSMIRGRKCLGGTIICSRDGVIVATYHLRGWDHSKDIYNLKLTSIGDRVDIKSLTEEMSKTGKSLTPFFDFLTANPKKAQVNDYQWRREPKLPDPEVIDKI